MSRVATRLAKLEAAASERDAQARPPPFDLSQILFPKQHAFVSDPKPFKTAVCSRRAGKTIGCAAALLKSARARADGVNVYITRSRKNAKRILWSTLKRMNREYGFGGTPNESDLCIQFPNGATIHLAGANDRDAIEDFRGLAMPLVVVDEAQSLPAYLEELVDDVLEPALMDYDGSLVLIGTPAPVPVGYFYDCATSDEWAHHSWTVFDNPHIERKSGKPPQAHLDRALKRRGVTVDDPKIQREWFGRWVYDPNSLVFRFDAGSNYFDALPRVDRPWQHVIGVDLGHDDADAIDVEAFSESDPNVYGVEELVQPKQTVTALAEQLAKMVEKYRPLAVVMDTGGLGKKIAAEITMRFGIPIKAAEKARKLEFIELMNDALRTGRMKVRRGSHFAHDANLVEWDRDKSKPDKLVISDRYHSDIADAKLYAFRESLHWLHQPPQETPPPGTPEWFDAEQKAMKKRAMAKAAAGRNEWNEW